MRFAGTRWLYITVRNVHYLIKTENYNSILARYPIVRRFFITELLTLAKSLQTLKEQAQSNATVNLAYIEVNQMT